MEADELHPLYPLIGPSDHDLTVVVPAYNEESRLPATLDGLAAYLEAWEVDYRVLVVDDGSSDGTARATEGRGARFATIRQARTGKGGAVRNGMLRATGRIVSFTDADLPYHLDSLRTAYETIQCGASEVVFGARDVEGSENRAARKLLRSAAHVVFRSLMRVLVSAEVTDTQCGLKAFSRRAALEIFSRTTINGFAFDAEVVFLTHRLGLAHARVPVLLINEYASTISLSRHAVPMLLDVLRVRGQAWRGAYDGDVAPVMIPDGTPPETTRKRTAA